MAAYVKVANAGDLQPGLISLFGASANEDISALLPFLLEFSRCRSLLAERGITVSHEAIRQSSCREPVSQECL
jgi:hypothetical protein